MRRTTRLAGIVAAVAAAAALTGAGVASATGATSGTSATKATKATSATPAVRPCSMDDVSFYFGGYSYGLGQRQFQITLLAHDGIACSLSDTPLLTVAGPPGEKKIPMEVNGRGGKLILRPDSPLHATVYYAVPDTEQDTLKVNRLTLAMPDHTSRTTSFLFPGVTEIYSGGVSSSSWTTGLGLGEGEQTF